MRTKLHLAGLLDKLVGIIEELEEYYEEPNFDRERTDREIQSVCKAIKLCLEQEFPIKTLTGEQRTISGVVE